MANYNYLLWDVDGTILNFAAAEKVAIEGLFEKYGFGTCSEEMLDHYIKINKKYWEALERGEMTKDAILVGRFVEFFEREGLNTACAKDFNADYQLALGDTIVFCDDAYDIIKKQKEWAKIVVITNGTAVAQEKKLKRSGIGQLADYIFISEEVGHEKPSELFFEQVVREAGITDLKEALVIGDSLTSDIQGGINAGMDTVWYNPNGQRNDKGIEPTFEIANLHELDQIV